MRGFSKNLSLMVNIAILLVICCCCLPAQAKYGGGTGEPNDPYLIYDANQMNAIGADSNDWDKNFKLMADVDMGQFTAEEYNIIGSNPSYPDYGTSFTGVFDGNGHTISNFSYTSAGTSYIGVFGYVGGDNAEIKDLGLIAPNVDAGTHGRVGSLVGGLREATITNCYAESGSVSGSELVGGLVGFNDESTISNCYSTASVSGNDLIGGLVGYNWDLCIITNCYSTGNVTGDRYVGGLVGYNYSGTIDNCDSSSDVEGNSAVGGLVGWTWDYSTITNCFSSGNVTGNGSVGGVVGCNNESTISNCYSTAIVVGNLHVGGLVGNNYEGSVLNCSSIGNVNGVSCVGGLVGCNSSWSAITNCYSKGDVSGENQVGGLVGDNYWHGKINNCYSTGSVVGNLLVGGLVGWNRNNSKAINSYSTGSVEGAENVGGLVGKNTWCVNLGNCYEDKVLDSFWDIETSGQTTSDGGTGLSTTYMQMASTFTDAGWDFTTPIWTIDDGNDYPRLWWEFVPTLHAEPEITLGTSNTISWEPIAGNIEYYVECSEDANFTNIIYNSGWIKETSFEFLVPQLGGRYWYSVKARNAEGVESQWSNVEFSLQGTLIDAVDIMLEPNSLKNENMKNALLNKIDEALEMIDEGDYTNALNKLENDILLKTNGCAESGEPDKNDWIITCEAQSEMYPLVIETIEYVESLMK